MMFYGKFDYSDHCEISDNIDRAEQVADAVRSEWQSCGFIPPLRLSASRQGSTELSPSSHFLEPMRRLYFAQMNISSTFGQKEIEVRVPIHWSLELIPS